jgi:hypothetical protein
LWRSGALPPALTAAASILAFVVMMLLTIWHPNGQVTDGPSKDDPAGAAERDGRDLVVFRFAAAEAAQALHERVLPLAGKPRT